MSEPLIITVITAEAPQRFAGSDPNETIDRAETFIVSTTRNNGAVEIKVDCANAATQAEIEKRLMKAAVDGAIGLL